MKNYNSRRRQVLKTLLYAGGAMHLPMHSSLLKAQSGYSGKLVIALQLDGGADATSFADPKANVAGEPEINRWARKADIMQAGNLLYAPYAENAAFFDKYYRDILAINGVDAQTNSHTVGVVNNWSGRNSIGFPTITSLFAAVNAPEFPLAYLNFGGYGATQGVISVTRVSNPDVLQGLVAPNKTPSWSSQPNWILPSRLERIKSLHRGSMKRMVADKNAVGGNYTNRQTFLSALTKTDSIRRFADFIPEAEELQEVREFGNIHWSNLHQQIQITLLAFKAEVAVAGDLYESGLDTHQKHDEIHPVIYANVTDAIDYLWTYAGELGLADRIVLVIGSDFGRTPYFNASDGKDHWPISTTLVMERNAGYTNRMLGETDEGHNAYRINPATARRDDDNGVIIRPAHVHKALRNYLGIEDSSITRRFPFNNVEDFNFFSA